MFASFTKGEWNPHRWKLQWGSNSETIVKSIISFRGPFLCWGCSLLRDNMSRAIKTVPSTQEFEFYVCFGQFQWVLAIHETSERSCLRALMVSFTCGLNCSEEVFYLCCDMNVQSACTRYQNQGRHTRSKTQIVACHGFCCHQDCFFLLRVPFKWVSSSTEISIVASDAIVHRCSLLGFNLCVESQWMMVGEFKLDSELEQTWGLACD